MTIIQKQRIAAERFFKLMELPFAVKGERVWMDDVPNWLFCEIEGEGQKARVRIAFKPETLIIIEAYIYDEEEGEILYSVPATGVMQMLSNAIGVHLYRMRVDSTALDDLIVDAHMKYGAINDDEEELSDSKISRLEADASEVNNSGFVGQAQYLLSINMSESEIYMAAAGILSFQSASKIDSPLIQKALSHINELHPSVTQVCYDIELRWHFLSDDLIPVAFNGKEDISLLEDSANDAYEKKLACVAIHI